MSMFSLNKVKQSKKGEIPWYIKDYDIFFREKTLNNIIIMGEKTYFSLHKKNRPYKDRINIVLTRNPQEYNDLSELHNNLFFVKNLGMALRIVKQHNLKKTFFIGGIKIFNNYHNLCDILWVTRIKKNYNCDLKIDFENLTKNFIKDSIIKETDEYIIEKYIINDKLLENEELNNE